MKPYVPPPKGNPHFPALFWDQKTGKSKVFHKPEDVPEGWGDAHPNDEAAKANVKAKAEAANPAKTLPLTREEITAALTDGGIEFKKNAPTAALYAQLTEAVKKALAEAEVQYPADADTKALLELLPKPE